MATVNKEIADKVIAGDGLYPGDHERVVKITKYNNQFNGGEAYGLIYSHMPKDCYDKSPACRNPVTYWEAK